MPKLTKDIYAVPNGKVYPEWIKAGETVDGAVADAADAMGALEKAKPQKKAMKAPENK